MYPVIRRLGRLRLRLVHVESTYGMNASGSGYTAFVESIRTYILLWTTPSWSLSLLLESERGRLSFILAVLSTFFSRILLRQPSLLQQALQRELESRPPSSDGDSAISAHTLRLVDSGYWRATRAQQAHAHGTSGFHSAPIFPEDLVSRIATAQGVSPASSGASGDDSAERAYLLLQEALDRVLVSYAIVEEVVLRAETSFAVDGSDDARLLELWKLLRPEGKLKGLVSKQWQEVRPSAESDIKLQRTEELMDLLDATTDRVPVRHAVGIPLPCTN